jgi:putative ABC transport system permease protein
VNESLKGAPGWLSSRHRRIVRHAFVVSELALSLVLLVGAGLLIRSLAKLNAIDPGFKYEGVTTAYVMPPTNDRQRNAQLYTQILANLRQQAGTDEVALDYPIPMSGRGWQSNYRIEGDPIPADLNFVDTDVNFVSPSFFSVMEVPLLGGRPFTDRETFGSPRVVVVNQTFARNHGGAPAVIGRRLRLGGPDDLRKDEDPDSPWATIVGVVGDVRQYSLEKTPREAVYQSLWQRPTGITAVFVRPKGAQPNAGEMIRKAVCAADANQPIMNVQPLSAVMHRAIAPRKLTTTLLGIFAALALAMATVGIYGVMSYTVAQRTREIGIRMALGARTIDVLRIFLAEGARVTLTGVLLGTAASFAATRLIASLLYGVTSLDPATFITVAGVLGTAALAACWLPSMRAAQVDPMKTLREE